MEAAKEAISSVMRTVVGSCETAVVVLLLLGIVAIVVLLGTLIGEVFTEHRHFKVHLPRLVDDLQENPNETAAIIKRSGLLLRQKKYLIELTRHPELTDAMRESLAVGLEYKERRRYDNIVKVTEVIARVAPMLGLLGTLIPLGPGIMALGKGDASTLSASLLTAFDTTSLGLMIAGVAVIISAVRKSWYKDYMVSFDALMECILEVEKQHDGTLEGGRVQSMAKEALKAASSTEKTQSNKDSHGSSTGAAGVPAPAAATGAADPAAVSGAADPAAVSGIAAPVTA